MIHYTEHYFEKQGVGWRRLTTPVYRLLDNTKWIDNFFNTGELRLSSFNSFRKNPDEFRGDRSEGDGFGYFEDEKGNTQCISYESGLNCLVLCTTTKVTPEIIKDFSAVGAIKILNPTLFGLEVCSAIKGARFGIEGRCNYKKHRPFRIEDDFELKRLLQSGYGPNTIEFKVEFRKATDLYELMLKQEKYAYQNEYRYCWILENRLEQDQIFVNAPDALQYCERIIF